MAETSVQGTVAVTADENAYQSLLSFAPQVDQGEVPNEANVSEVAEGRIVRLALAEGIGEATDEPGIGEVTEGRIVRLALAEGVGEGTDEPGVGEVPEGRVVRLALTDGADGQQIIQEVPADQLAEMVSVPQDSSLVQHIQIQPLGQEISQGEVITLTLEEAQQLLQQQIVAGEGVEGMQPGIYQIMTSGVTQTADGQMFVAPGEGISLLQPGTTEALSGFDGQQAAVSYFQPTPEDLQPQLSQINTSAGDVTSGNIEAASSGDGTQTVMSYDTLTAVSLGRSLLNQSVQGGQSENTLHVDFHVNQPETVTQLTTQIEASTGNSAQSTSVGTVNVGQLQGCPISTASTPGLLAPLGMSLPINVQATAADMGLQHVVTQQTQTSRNSQAIESITEEKKLLLEDYKLKPIPTLKKIGEACPALSKPGEVRPDLSKPIEVKDEMEVVVKGKKCLLKVDPDSGKLTAYPILPPPGTKKRGRPKKSEQEKREAVNAKMSTPAPDHTSRAAQGLLELSNTVESGNTSGPEGIRRSGRVRKKARTLEDYEMLEVSSDDDGGIKVEEGEGEEEDVKRLKLEQDYIPPNSILLSLPAPNPTPVKRGRGRPRRYPPPGQPTTTQIPTMIIPTSDGQTIMMAPIQGLSNLQAFQEQIKNISIIPKSLTGAAIAPITGATIAPVPESPATVMAAQMLQPPMADQTSAASLADAAYPATSGIPLTGESVESVISDDGGTTIVIRARPDPQEIDSANFVDNPVLMQSNEDIAEPVIPDETEPPDTTPDFLKSEDTVDDDDDTETKEAIDSLQDMSRITVKNGENQPTIIQIPENLLPMFMQKKEPLKLGLKSSEDALEKMKCIKCNFQAYYEQQYQSHIATHVDDIQKCKACNFVAFEKEDLLAHFREVHPKCICNVCDFMAEHGYIIKRHMMRHSVDGCRCDICGKCYKDQYVLKMHIKMVHMPAEVLFECMICAKKFTRKAHLKRHLRIHDPEKPFKCPHCEYRGCEKSDISKHLLIHEEPQHICEVCGKAFRHIKNKELHLKRHNGQRDYKCGVCDFYGYTFTDIRKHIERKHTDAKTIICDKCGAAFKTDWHLKEHQRLGNCEMFMIEQALAIATSDGSSSKATIQIPTSMSLEGVIDGQQLQINGQSVILDLNMGQYTMKEEQVKLPGDAVTLTEEQIQEAVNHGQIIDTATAESMIMQVTDTGVHSVKLGAVGGVCLTDNEEEDEEEEEEETEDDINVLNRNIQSMVSEMSD